jgi:hypothetical protein
MPVGDDRQLAAIDADGGFRALLHRLGVPELVEDRRAVPHSSRNRSSIGAFSPCECLTLNLETKLTSWRGRGTAHVGKLYRPVQAQLAHPRPPPSATGRKGALWPMTTNQAIAPDTLAARQLDTRSQSRYSKALH